MLKIVYDRNFRAGTEKTSQWNPVEGAECPDLPDIEAHRIIELHATGAAKDFIENIVGSMSIGDWLRVYGDIARTVWINLEGEFETVDEPEGEFKAVDET